MRLLHTGAAEGSRLMSGMEDVLMAHQRQNSSSCLCGWSELGKSHPAHQAAMLAAAGFGEIWKHQAAAHGFNMLRRDAEAKLEAAWDEGAQAGHDAMIGKFHENPYRAAITATEGA
jgi:hypothetical protein